MRVYRKPGLRGLEIWNARTSRGALQELEGRAFFEGLREVVTRGGFERVVFCGGRSRDPLVKEIFPEAMYEVDGAGVFAARGGVRRVAEELGWARFLGVDVGQTQWKICRAREERVAPRVEDWRGVLRAVIREAKAEGVVLGLPVEIDDADVARPSTYEGMSGPVAEIFAGFEGPMVVMNDAVLAALGYAPREGERLLVVTLGYGAGAALWEA